MDQMQLPGPAEYGAGNDGPGGAQMGNPVTGTNWAGGRTVTPQAEPSGGH